MSLITGNDRPAARRTSGRAGKAGAEEPADPKAGPTRRSRAASSRRRTRPKAEANPTNPANAAPAAPEILSTAGAAPAHAHPQTVIFVDIPMTAGPAMRAVVRRQYAPGEVLAVYRPLMEQTLQDLRALDDDRKRRSKFILGHVSFGVHELLPDPPACKYVTVLRDPVDRVIDEYEYIRRTKEHFLHEQVRRMTLKDFAKAGLSNGTQNGQTKYLTQSRWASLPGKDGAAGGGDAVRALASNALEQAKRNLDEHFLVVGLAEELDATLMMMKRRLGWKLPFYAGMAQPPPAPRSLRASAPADGVRAIEAHNELDLQLYEWSRKRFEQSVWKTGLLFQAELRGFQALNAWYAFHRRGGR